jgi:3-hydroxybutyryl-CoA dehydrogenase
MQVVIRSSEESMQELIQNGLKPGCVLYPVSSIQDFLQYPAANAFIDLLFENTPEEITVLKDLKGLVIIDSVADTLQETDPSFIRINAWPGFLNGALIEGSFLKEEAKKKAEYVLQHFTKAIEWLPDVPGFVTPRVISMIINEAYFALEEGVSTKAEIDIAMKLGTAYPYGPFEWAERIGRKKIVGLLNRLSKEREQYKPAPWLAKEVLTGKA